MLGKILSDTYAKVRTKTDEIGATVRQQAARAVNEVLGLPNRPMTATELGQHLEREALYMHRLSSIAEMYGRWLHQVMESSKGRVVFMDEEIPVVKDELATSDENQKSPVEAAQVSSGSEVPTTALTVPEGVEENDAFKSPVSEGSAATRSSGVVSPEVPRRQSEGERGDESFVPRGVGLTFKQVLLRSKALELSLVTVSRLDEVKTALAGPVEDEEGEDSPRVVVQKLLSLCLRGDAKLRMELLFLFCTADSASDERHTAFLTHLVSILKVDWRDDFLFESRRELATEIERVKFEINHTASPPPTSSASEVLVSSSDDFEGRDGSLTSQDQMTLLVAADKHAMRVKASVQLMQLYEETQENLRKSADFRQDHFTKTMAKLKIMQVKLEASGKDCEVAQHEAGERSSQLQKEMEKVGEDLVGQIGEVDKEKNVLEGDIAKLDERRHDLLLKLDELTKQIDDLQQVKKRTAENVAKMTEELDSIRRRYRSKMATEDGLKHHSENRRQDLQNIHTVALQSEQQLEPVLIAAAEDVDLKCKKIRRPAQELMSKHLSYELQRLKHHKEVMLFFVRQLERLGPEVEKFSDSPPETMDAACSSDQLNGSADSVDGLKKAQVGRQRYLRGRLMDFRLKFGRSVAQLEEAWAEVQNFKCDRLAIMTRSSSSTEVPESSSSNVVDEEEFKKSCAASIEQLEAVYRDIRTNIVAPGVALLAEPVPSASRSAPIPTVEPQRLMAVEPSSASSVTEDTDSQMVPDLVPPPTTDTALTDSLQAAAGAAQLLHVKKQD